MRRGGRRAAQLNAVVAAVLGAAGCSMFSGTPLDFSPPPPKISQTPAVGGHPVTPADRPNVRVQDGVIKQVTLTNAHGKAVAGRLSPDKRSWMTTDPLEFDTTYRWSGSVEGAGGQARPISGTFATVKPQDTPRASINITDHSEVGVGAPIIIQFHGKVQDRAAAERALSVQTNPVTEGSWGWLPDNEEGSRVHWRPKEYWKAGTQVTVNANLFGVPYGGGAYGKENISSSFRIGRAQIVKGDVNSHRLVVERDGKQVADYPASYGLDSAPDRNTRSGVHVVTDKFESVLMTSQVYGYSAMEKWAVKINDNGEFIHANPETVGMQGSSNVSHGCVNLSDSDGEAYFRSSLYGDPVEITGSGQQLTEADGDIADWTVSWKDWTARSALANQAPAPVRPPQ